MPLAQRLAAALIYTPDETGSRKLFRSAVERLHVDSNFGFNRRSSCFIAWQVTVEQPKSLPPKIIQKLIVSRKRMHHSIRVVGFGTVCAQRMGCVNHSGLTLSAVANNIGANVEARIARQS